VLKASATRLTELILFSSVDCAMTLVKSNIGYATTNDNNPTNAKVKELELRQKPEGITHFFSLALII
jgi:hypothetical protein